MGKLTEKPEDIGMDSKIQAKTDKIDLNNEIAGIDTGKSWRFLSKDSSRNPYEKAKRKAEREYRSMLDMLLAEDPQYAALYHQVSEKIDKAQQAVDSALIEINERLEASDRKLQKMKEKAATLPDGTKVFKSSKDNSIYTEHGKRLSAEKAQKIKIPDHAPSWEAYRSEKDKNEMLQRDKKKLEEYKTDVLYQINRRMNDKDNPISKEELEDLEKNFPKLPVLETKSINMPAEYQINKSSAANSIDPDSDQSMAAIKPKFEKAHDGLLDLAELNAVEPKKTVTPAP